MEEAKRPDSTQRLNLPPADLRIARRGERLTVFDPLRRRYVALTPEEWVRQHFVHFLQKERGFPPEVIANEVSLSLNGTRKRCDTVIYGAHAEPLMIVEYKAPEVEITQHTFNQIGRYNIRLRVEWLVVSNGMQHFCCHIDYESGQYRFLPQIPSYAEIADENHPDAL